MRIIQITDLHIHEIGQDNNGINTTNNFLEVLKYGQSYNPDLIVITGDICHKEGELMTYQWLKEKLDETNIKYFAIPGNHDSSQLMAEVFGYKLIDGEFYYTYHIEGRQLIFLDTSKGKMLESQYKWLINNCKHGDIIFMHHPPVNSGVLHMDSKYTYEEKEKFEACLKYPTAIFTGHCHTERTIQKGKMSVFITPSCFLQIGDKTEAFYKDHEVPAFRLIDISENGDINTCVKYLLNKDNI